eukprot:Gb_40688 [translate_table: standard]
MRVVPVHRNPIHNVILQNSYEVRASEDKKMVEQWNKSSAVVTTNKTSHVISKPYTASNCEETSSKWSQQKISSAIRVVHVYAPKVIKSDPANFRSLVQKLTGKSSRKSKASRDFTKRSKEKKKISPKSPDSAISLEINSKNSEDIDNVLCGDELQAMPKMDQDPLMDSSDNHNFGLSQGLNDLDMILPSMMNREQWHDFPLINNNSPFCNIYDQSGVCRLASVHGGRKSS